MMYSYSHPTIHYATNVFIYKTSGYHNIYTSHFAGGFIGKARPYVHHGFNQNTSSRDHSGNNNDLW